MDQKDFESFHKLDPFFMMNNLKIINNVTNDSLTLAGTEPIKGVVLEI
jgi:hypothetical protein